ncbi:putative zinc finger in N-recognin-domain-containing protein [Podospora australis]|uniref:Zinc finger in N-recognin-domain-containing protein n=1 Tax=Podospora australis TaxID=1536484 RepID=A0AAN6WUR7_9PEZI|nr:putative zinc finger in N-recognin-domain-containing protein [Podospora australis]
MDAPSAPQPAAAATNEIAPASTTRSKPRSESIGSQTSTDSKTAAEFLREQLQLEADAREALPYSIENCTQPLGPLRQAVFACLTCNPPPADPSSPYTAAAGVCYACSVQCHGEHTLVEIFNKRNFTCDCGTTRFPPTEPCNLRINPETGTKGGVHSQEPDANNQYNQNFRNRFCGCECDYDPNEQKGTMFQCLGLGTHETRGCGEDWWHPGCVVGLGPKWFEGMEKEKKTVKTENGGLATISEDAEEAQNGETQAPAEEEDDEDDDPPLPPGFPAEEDFEHFICYKCVEAYPWIKRYAATPGFLPPVFHKTGTDGAAASTEEKTSVPAVAVAAEEPVKTEEPTPTTSLEIPSTKRKAEDDDTLSQSSKRPRTSPVPTSQDGPSENQKDSSAPQSCRLLSLPPAPSGTFSLFVTADFRTSLCHCPTCFPLLVPHPQLLEEEETYEPPVSEPPHSAPNSEGGSSLYDRGESALRNVDRVRAIEGVMAYNHMKEKLQPFFKQFAESGQAISAEDIKSYFAKLRGDDTGTNTQTTDQGEEKGGGGEGGGRTEQSGY